MGERVERDGFGLMEGTIICVTMNWIVGRIQKVIDIDKERDNNTRMKTLSVNKRRVI